MENVRRAGVKMWNDQIPIEHRYFGISEFMKFDFFLEMFGIFQIGK